jgi:hypothetical protein
MMRSSVGVATLEVNTTASTVISFAPTATVGVFTVEPDAMELAVSVGSTRGVATLEVAPTDARSSRSRPGVGTLELAETVDVSSTRSAGVPTEVVELMAFGVNSVTVASDGVGTDAPLLIAAGVSSTARAGVGIVLEVIADGVRVAVSVGEPTTAPELMAPGVSVVSPSV